MAKQEPTHEQLANRLARNRTKRAAQALVERVDADCFTELVARSTLAGRMTGELFRLLDEAFTAHLQAREIAALPEATP